MIVQDESCAEIIRLLKMQQQEGQEVICIPQEFIDTI